MASCDTLCGNRGLTCDQCYFRLPNGQDILQTYVSYATDDCTYQDVSETDGELVACSDPILATSKFRRVQCCCK